jgi:hypothetical protein
MRYLIAALLAAARVDFRRREGLGIHPEAPWHQRPYETLEPTADVAARQAALNDRQTK